MLTFTTDADGVGSGLIGYITTTYDQLVDMFGPGENFGSDDKVTQYWGINIHDDSDDSNAIITIYDYKMHGTPKGLYDWHLGGMSVDVIDKFSILFPQAEIKKLY